ncbi:sorbosone dehydrogenase family protein, partial [bacterium]
VGMALRPGTSELWSVINERDRLGDDVPPDYLTRVQDGAFYGWPYAYTDINGQIFPDPNFGTKEPDMLDKTVAPDVPVQAHSAALGVAFYPLQGGNFPKDYAGDAFLTYHGSWNRTAKTGYKVVRVNFEAGKPKAVTDFVTGYLEGNSAWGRPVDVQVAPDGSLLFSDDGGGKIWRVSYAGK